MWYIAECQDCTPILKQPFGKLYEHEAWVKAHVNATGHSVNIWQENLIHEMVSPVATISKRA
jgi:hypothetical protein